MAVLDTAFLIDMEQARPSALRMRQRLHDERHVLRVPAVVWLEFLHVIPAAKRSRAAAELESIGRFEPFDRHLADAGAALQHDLRKAGRPLAWHDLQVAVTALHNGEPIVSRDTSFDGIPGLARLAY